MSALRVPVMVMGEHTAGDVGLVRSLGIAGVPVHLLTPYVRGSTAASRYVHRIHAFPGPEAPVAERMAALRRIATAIGGRPPVMMAGDGPLALISENREQLGDVLTHDLPPREVVDVCFFKDQFAVHAQRLGLPTPETFVPANAGDVEARAATLSYPVFVKPFTKRAGAACRPASSRRRRVSGSTARKTSSRYSGASRRTGRTRRWYNRSCRAPTPSTTPSTPMSPRTADSSADSPRGRSGSGLRIAAWAAWSRVSGTCASLS